MEKSKKEKCTPKDTTFAKKEIRKPKKDHLNIPREQKRKLGKRDDRENERKQ